MNHENEIVNVRIDEIIPNRFQQRLAFDEKELNELKSYMKTCSNVLLFSKRRMGKSTLIKNLFSEIENDYIVIYIDIYNIITAEDFGKLLLNGITKSQKGDIKSST